MVEKFKIICGCARCMGVFVDGEHCCYCDTGLGDEIQKLEKELREHKSIIDKLNNLLKGKPMSMNLYFRVKGAPTFARVDFPWQTPTEITYAVIEASTNEEKLKILRDSISHWNNDVVEEKLKEVQQLLTCDNLELAFW